MGEGRIRPGRRSAEFLAAAKDQRLKLGGTGSKQEDQIIAAAITKASGAPFTYIPFRGGGEVAVQLVGGHIDATVNNPIEAVTHWRSGALRPLCVFDDKRLPYTEKMTETQAWSDIPTAREQGLDVDYLMLRGIFMPAGVKPEQVAFYEGLMAKVRETPEWKDLMQQGAFNTTALAGDAFRAWLTKEDDRHKTLMQEAGFLAAAVLADDQGDTCQMSTTTLEHGAGRPQHRAGRHPQRDGSRHLPRPRPGRRGGDLGQRPHRRRLGRRWPAIRLFPVLDRRHPGRVQLRQPAADPARAAASRPARCS